MQDAWAYVDPGSGFVFLQNTSPYWAFLLIFLLLPLRFAYRFIKKHFKFFIILVALLILGAIILENSMNKNAGQNIKVIVLGIDAMDPDITEKLMSEGRLPNFSKLVKDGSFSRLATTNPSESIVAWSSFATGLGPGSHGIFDFVMRNPGTYVPYLAFSETSSDSTKQAIRKKGTDFWAALTQNKVPSYIYFCPNTFPPEKILGRMVSGMGVPDVLGMVGKFSFYTSKPLQASDKESRGRIVHVEAEGGLIRSSLYGPKVKSDGRTEETTIPLWLKLEREKDEAIVNIQGNSFALKKGQWSGWKKVSFNLGFMRKAHGIIRFYLRSVAPDLELYVSPINFDPEKPLFPISYPADCVRKIAQRLGLFYTQGMPHDTWALSEGRIDEKVFLEHADIILKERTRILTEELNKFRKGVFFFYFDTLDVIQHMFWRYTDPKNTSYEPNSPYQDTIFKYYEKIDRILGDILKEADDQTTVIVLSDHGFASFRRAAHLNSWLKENGYLFLKDDARTGREFFEDVDWSKTRAYSIGFGGIYFNRIGREQYGIVDQSEVAVLKKEIAEKLKQWQDQATGENVVYDVYPAEKIFQGPYENDAPDLFVGFNRGYRASWQTALGATPEGLLEDNKKKWSGDHLMDPNLVPGVLFINKKVNLASPRLIDIAPAILGEFGLQQKNADGKKLFDEREAAK